MEHDTNKVAAKTANGRVYYRWSRCESCGAQLVTQREWNAADAETRAFWRDEGMMRQSVGPYCYKRACQRARREKENSDDSA